MKTQIILMGLLVSLIPLTLVGQKKYFNLDFENTDSVGKIVIQWQYPGIGTEFYVDSTTSTTGKNSLFTNLQHVDQPGGISFYFALPTTYYTGLRSINISGKIMIRNEKPTAGLWCKVKKGNDLLGSASTFKGPIPFPVIPYTPAISGANVPVSPYSWTPYSFDIKVDQDPTEVIIGLFVLTDRAWFDNIVIKINGKPIDLVFEM